MFDPNHMFMLFGRPRPQISEDALEVESPPPCSDSDEEVSVNRAHSEVGPRDDKGLWGSPPMITSLPKRLNTEITPQTSGKRIKFTNNQNTESNKRASGYYETGNGVAIATELPRAPPRPRRPDIFREFRDRYPPMVTAPNAPEGKRKGLDILEAEFQRRNGGCAPGFKVRQPIAGGFVQPPKTVPYLGTLEQFITACVYLQSLLKKNHTALHRSLWDDFIRFFTSVWAPKLEAWLHAQEDEHLSQSEDPFLGNLQIKDRCRLMQPALSMYCERVHRPVYSGGILSPDSLPVVLGDHCELTTASEVIVASWAGKLFREGHPIRGEGL